MKHLAARDKNLYSHVTDTGYRLRDVIETRSALMPLMYPGGDGWAARFGIRHRLLAAAVIASFAARTSES